MGERPSYLIDAESRELPGSIWFRANIRRNPSEVDFFVVATEITEDDSAASR